MHDCNRRGWRTYPLESLQRARVTTRAPDGSMRVRVVADVLVMIVSTASSYHALT